jgi:hypothetical protein
VEQRSGFWLIADAVKQFYDKHKCLPLSGKVPDMKAQSTVYIRLQNIYKDKARKDATEILQTVQAAPGGERVDPAEVDLFCKNAASVKLINATGGGGDARNSRAERLRSAAGMPRPCSLHTLACSRPSPPTRMTISTERVREGSGEEPRKGEKTEEKGKANRVSFATAEQRASPPTTRTQFPHSPRFP